MKHPGKKQLIDVLIGFKDSNGLKAAEAHVKECRECSETMESLKNIMHTSDNSSIAPPEYIEREIISSAGVPLKTGYGKKNIISSGRFLRPVIAAAAVVIVAFTAIVFFIIRDTSVNVALKLSPDHGNVTYDNITIKNQAEIKQGRIKTEDVSSAILILGDALSIRLAEDSDLSLLSAKEYTGKNNKKYDVSFDLKNGFIMVTSDHDLMKKYAIRTPYAVFEPVGTEYVLSSDINSSRLSVTEGLVHVTAINKSEILLKKGEGCEVNTDGIKKINIDPQNVLESFNKEFSKIKTKSNLAPGKALMNDIPGNDEPVRDKEENLSPDDNKSESSKSVNDHRESLKDKSLLRNDAKEIKRGLRNNFRSGKGR